MPNQVAVSSVDQAGDIGGQGISRWYWVMENGNADIQPADVDQVHAAIHGFYSGLTTWLPQDITYAVQPAVSVIDLQSSQLVGLVSGTTAVQDVKGAATTSSYPAGVGVRINWQTPIVLAGRRLRGALYLVPLAGNSYGSTGSIISAVQQAVINAASGYHSAVIAAGGTQVVYHRNPKGQDLQGTAGPVNSWTVGTTPASLRSRRV